MAFPQPPAPPADQESPHYAGQPPIVFEGFTTLNTDASRPGIEKNQMFVCDGWMPLGKNNLRTLYGIGVVLYTASAGLTIVCYCFANIAATPWCVVFLSDGSVQGVNTTTLLSVTIMPPGTIQNPAIGNVGVSQWGIQGILIVAQQPNGYWLWTGTILTGAGTTTAFVVVTNGGSGYSATPTISLSGGSGSGAVLQATVQGGIIVSIQVLNPGTGYLAGDTVTVGITDATGTGATASLATMPFGISGNTVETYSSHVWVGNGSTIFFSAPEDPTDFATSDGGGSFQLLDSFTRVSCIRLVQNNGFLWIVCDSSISYISNVNTGGTPVTTTFTKQNANPEVGTPWPAGVQTFGQYLVLGNPFGVHVQSGGSIEKISDFLDGIYNTVPNFAGLSPSTAKAIIFGKKVFMLLLPVIDEISGQQINKLFMWAGKGWWTSQQDSPLIYIAGQEINSVQTAYGTDGTNIFPLFATPSTGFSKVVQSKLFAEPGFYGNKKAASRLWGLAQYYSDLSPDLIVSIDNENGIAPQTIVVPGLVVTWRTAGGLAMNWTTATGAPMVWTAAGGVSVFPPTAVGQNGVLIGLTVTTNCADVALLSLAIGAEIETYRG